MYSVTASGIFGMLAYAALKHTELILSVSQDQTLNALFQCFATEALPHGSDFFSISVHVNVQDSKRNSSFSLGQY